MSRKSVVTVARAAVLGMAAVALWGLTPGCGGPSVGAYCNKACDCLGCSESERDECTDALEDVKKAADDDGCSDQFNAYLGCVNDELECKDDQLSADGCEAEAEELGECSAGGSSIGKNACEKLSDQIVALYEGCGVDYPDEPGGNAECTDDLKAQAECLSPCIDKLPCECLAQSENCTSELTEPYIDCVSGCQ